MATAPGSSAQQPLLLLGAPATAASSTPGTAGSGPVTVRGSGGDAVWSALDGLYQLLTVGRDQHPEVSHPCVINDDLSSGVLVEISHTDVFPAASKPPGSAVV